MHSAPILDKIIKCSKQFTVEDEVNAYNARTLFIECVPDDSKEDEDRNDNDGINIALQHNKHEITVKEVDETLGSHGEYIAYIVDTLGNITIKQDAVSVKVARS